MSEWITVRNVLLAFAIRKKKVQIIPEWNSNRKTTELNIFGLKMKEKEKKTNEIKKENRFGFSIIFIESHTFPTLKEYLQLYNPE